MLARLLYLVVLTILSSLILRLVSEWLGLGSGGKKRAVGGASDPSQPMALKGHLVRDPVCGLNLPEEKAIRYSASGEPRFFCSERCRNTFVANESEKRARA